MSTASDAWVPSFFSLLGDDKQLLVVSVACWTLLRASLVAQRAEVNRQAVDLDPSRVVFGANIRFLYQYVVGP